MNRHDREQLREDPPRMSPQRWAFRVEDGECCLRCVKRWRSRWGKHPDDKPAKKERRK